MDELSILTRRLQTLERRWRRTATIAVVLATVALAAALLVALRRPPDILRARGLVITDDAGKPRIVLGAPLRDVIADVRLERTVGLAVLDASGRLNVAVGAGNPAVEADGSVADRMGSAVGLNIYDPRNGAERGGMGAFDDGRAILCLDYGAKGKEAACLSVDAQDANAAVVLNGTPDESAFDRVTMYVGNDGTGAIKVFGGGDKANGLLLKAGSGPPALLVYDNDKEVGQAVWKPAR
jgi:hypothetical protein